MADIRTKYKVYIQTILQDAGYADPQGAAGRVMDLETEDRKGARDARSESEDFEQGAQVWTRQQLEQKAPGIDWAALLGAAGLGNAPKFDAYHYAAIPKLSALVASEPLQNWKDWLAFHTLNQQSNVLPKAFRDASFAFYGTQLQGTPQQRPRDALALNATSAVVQDAVGKAYVDKYFPASSKAEIQEMVDNLKAAFARRVKAIGWMSPSTKQEALKKVENIVVGVGYPDSWRDYAGLQITGDDAYANQKNARLWEYRHQIEKIGKPMDRHEWWMPPQLVNAVNLPVQNALNFPAAILANAVLRSERGRGVQLRRDRRDDRARDQPQLRHRRRPVRCAGSDAQLVDSADFANFQEQANAPRRSVRRATRRSRACTSTAS